MTQCDVNQVANCNQQPASSRPPADSAEFDRYCQLVGFCFIYLTLSHAPWMLCFHLPLFLGFTVSFWAWSWFLIGVGYMFETGWNHQLNCGIWQWSIANSFNLSSIALQNGSVILGRSQEEARGHPPVTPANISFDFPLVINCNRGRIVYRLWDPSTDVR